MEKFYKLLLAKLKLFGKKEKINTGDTGLEKLKPILEDPTFEIEGYSGQIYYTNGFYFIKAFNNRYAYIGKENIENIRA